MLGAALVSLLLLVSRVQCVEYVAHQVYRGANCQESTLLAATVQQARLCILTPEEPPGSFLWISSGAIITKTHYTDTNCMQGATQAQLETNQVCKTAPAFQAYASEKYVAIAEEQLEALLDGGVSRQLFADDCTTSLHTTNVFYDGWCFSGSQRLQIQCNVDRTQVYYRVCTVADQIEELCSLGGKCTGPTLTDFSTGTCEHNRALDHAQHFVHRVGSRVDCLLHCAPGYCLGDIAGHDAQVGVDDLAALLVRWGPVTFQAQCGEFTGDSLVSVQDLAALLVSWGACV